MKKIILAVMMTLALASAASAGMSDAIVRVVITGKDVNLRTAPHPEADVVSKVSAPDEYIAARYRSVYAGTDGDGSEWYELLGVTDSDDAIAPSIEGRSAAGALLDRSLYISAKYVREIPLRDGDAEAVREMVDRGSARAGEPQGASDRFLADLERYVGRTPMEAASLHSDALISKWWDTDDEDFSPFAEVLTAKMCATYLGDDLLQYDLAASGAEIGGVVLGHSTEAEIRELLGDPTSEGKTDEDAADGFKYAKNDLSGGVRVYDPDRPTELAVPFKAVKAFYYDWPLGDEGFGNSMKIFFDEAGRAVAIEKRSYGWR